jgi:3-oxoacyl-[acyl-carrier protein] reductase
MISRASQCDGFSGSTALITGAAGAIGAETARLFHAQGANIVLADYDAEGIEVLAAELDASGHTVIPLRYDAAMTADAALAVTRSLEAFGRLDYVVPSAGIYPQSPFALISNEDWERTIRINLGGVFQLCRAAATAVREGGAIVTIASIAGHRGSAEHAHYAAAKGGVLALTRSMARELAPRIRVNAVSPGIIATPMVASLLEDRGAALKAETPMGRFGRPEEVASVIAFLCSDAASFINGETVHVNGGLYMA